MGTGIDPSEHVKFLVNCIKNAKDGKVDFNRVARDLNIVTKAAAAKRYERLLKSHDVNSNGTPAVQGDGNGFSGAGGEKTPSRKRGVPKPDADDGELPKEKRSRPTKGQLTIKAGGSSGKGKAGKGRDKANTSRTIADSSNTDEDSSDSPPSSSPVKNEAKEDEDRKEDVGTKSPKAENSD